MCIIILFGIGIPPSLESPSPTSAGFPPLVISLLAKVTFTRRGRKGTKKEEKKEKRKKPNQKEEEVVTMMLKYSSLIAK
jgi:hypothetical protein